MLPRPHPLVARTRALEDQLLAMKVDQRPFLWVRQTDESKFIENTPKHDGQIAWHVEYENFGRGVGDNVAIKRYIKIGDETFKDDYAAENFITNDTGLQIPPGRVDHFTIMSRPGFSNDYFRDLLTIGRSVAIMIEFSYTNIGGKERYNNVICMERLAAGVTAYRNPKDCRK